MAEPSPPEPGRRELVAREPAVPPGVPLPSLTVLGPGAPGGEAASRWVPLVPASDRLPQGVAGRSGAFLMVATRAEPESRASRAVVAEEVELRSALVSCLEVLLPQLEPGWAHCHEHTTCRAVQEATGALWGGSQTPGSGPTPSAPSGPAEPPPVRSDSASAGGDDATSP